ncbi:MAG: phosphoribosyltransferase [Phycisphaeraceae bacterium]
MPEPYRDRIEAGEVLAATLRELADRPDVTILGLPRGGVPVAAEVATTLNLPLDVMVVRKLGVPGQEELAMGAIAGGGASVLNDALVAQLNIPADTVNLVTDRQRREVQYREHLYRGEQPPLSLTGRTVVLVDDGIATGATMRAAVQMARQLGANTVIVAVPVAPDQAIEKLARVADRVVCPKIPADFYAVGQWYENFEQVGDDEVREFLKHARDQRAEGQRHDES